ncbi:MULTISPECIES: hypothetical protein [unclassified Bradyrhizobium]|uniref:hypothetical protein n=1 Tax=unclassified Bradyrhizobium TaxID=2631580 RepID=UPI001FF741A2|nr:MULTISPECIES: hypothetical protein [unclassified Bradyrhizobium]MCK1268744.1 hypothetical protein [Bradyrhizobium sp. 84]MCK1376719.1 hypothetical protein [Bradyrhizobium sp. 49]MCK1556648.1 hypothetical protein [Bradyrhizobium sp. 171]MCK1584097.1 hypothetical protein [Bradyrhizobium sp. 168]MCK1604376.1 hypothetical protein [Bradyrhizobium sp. 166]
MFAALDITAEFVNACLQRTWQSSSWTLLKAIDTSREGLAHIIMDNYATHPATQQARLIRRPVIMSTLRKRRSAVAIKAISIKTTRTQGTE